jgi:hypothetical protein
MSFPSCPVLAVLSRLSCPSSPVPNSPVSAVLTFLLCFGRTVLSVLSLPSCPRCHVLTIVSCPDSHFPALRSGLSCPGSLILAVLSPLSCPGSPVSCPGCIVLAVLSSLSPPGSLVSAVQSRLSCPGFPVLAVLSGCPVGLSCLAILSCYLRLAVLLLLSGPGCRLLSLHSCPECKLTSYLTSKISGYSLMLSKVNGLNTERFKYSRC